MKLEIKVFDDADVVTHQGIVDVPPVEVVDPPDPPDPTQPTAFQRVNIVESATAPQDVPTWDYANMRLMLVWSRGKKGANWLDANGIQEGTASYVTWPMLTAPPANSYVFTSIPPALIEKLRADNTGFLIGGGPTTQAAPKFATINWNGNKPPLLEIVTTTGTFNLPCVLDTWTTSTSNSSQHQVHYFSPQFGILRFDLSTITGVVQSAKLSLYPLGWYGPYTMTIDFLDIPELLTQPAAQHPELVQPALSNTVQESALATHPDVLVYGSMQSVAAVEGFTQQGWVQGNGRTNRFEQMPNGLWAMYCYNDPIGSTATNSRNLTLNNPQQRNPKPWQTAVGSAPEELYLGYMIKMPNIAGTAWQGTKIPGLEGFLGWQMGGGYAYQGWTSAEKFPDDMGWGLSAEHNLASPANNNAAGFGMYVYDQDRKLSSPERGRYTPSNFAFLPNVWYHIEIQAKMNTVGQSNGTLAAWVDGVKVFENTAWKARGDQRAQVLSLVMLIMHGGNGIPTGSQEYGLARWTVSKVRVGPPQVSYK